MNHPNNEVNRDIKIIIATHKKYQMPQDNIYVPLYVGACEKDPLEYLGDNTGENISSMNPYFCELTGLYWMWKNVNADYMGLVHYRRHFCLQRKKGMNKMDSKWKSILSSSEAQLLCRQFDVIVPSKRYYIIESLESHYAHTHYIEHLEKTRKIIEKYYPEYLGSYDNCLKKRSGYMFNMFLMRSDLVNEYCGFLFDILFELNKQIDTSDYSRFQKRYLGRVGEILLNVWLDKRLSEQGEGEARSRGKDKLKIKEIRHIHMEKINWWNKGVAFLKAKFGGERYEHGF